MEAQKWGRVACVLVRHLVQLSNSQSVLVMDDMVVRGAVCALDPCMAVQEEVILERVDHTSVNDDTCSTQHIDFTQDASRQDMFSTILTQTPSSMTESEPKSVHLNNCRTETRCPKSGREKINQ